MIQGAVRLRTIRYAIISPTALYAVIFGAYIIFPTISTFFFADEASLFLGDIWDVDLVKKGFALYLLSLIFFGLGQVLSRRIIWHHDYFGQHDRRHYLSQPSASLLKFSIIPLMLIAIALQGSFYFDKVYAGGDDAYGFFDLPATVRAGVAIQYFVFEYITIFILIWDWNRFGRLRSSSLIIVFFSYCMMVSGMKRLEMLTPMLALLGFIYLDSRRSLHVLWVIFLGLVVLFSLIGALRLNNDFDFTSFLSFVLEANFTTNSFYRTIDLIDNQNYPLTYGSELLSLPYGLIPSVFFPEKFNVINPVGVWSDRAAISPLGAFYGLAHLYRFGGVWGVILGSWLLGLLLGVLYHRFVASQLQVRGGFSSIFYPVVVLPFLFHYVRDDLVVALKMLLQFSIIYGAVMLVPVSSPASAKIGLSK